MKFDTIILHFFYMLYKNSTKIVEKTYIMIKLYGSKRNPVGHRYQIQTKRF
jgi:hypothetical protein